MRILGIDLGQTNTGLAVSDEHEILASPLSVIKEKNKIILAQKICKIAARESICEIALGLPKNMDGSEGKSAQTSRKFAKTLEKMAGISVFMQDERGTTITAHEYLNEVDINKNKRKKVVDAVAAVIILQDYLNTKANLRNKLNEST